MKINHSFVEKAILILILPLFLVSSAFGGASRDFQVPVHDVVMIVTVKLKGESPKIDKVVVQKGLLNPIRQDDTKLASFGLGIRPRLILVDLLGNILHATEFEYLRVVTVPPGPPGSPKDDSPSVILLEEPEITLVAPYFFNIDTVQIVNPGETEPATTKSILDAEFSQELDEELLLEPGSQPPPSEPGKFNILIVASGYDSSNMTQFESKAQEVKNFILDKEPFKGSAQEVQINIFNNTANLGCFTGCYNIDRLMCCDGSLVVGCAAGSGYHYDEVIVIHNTNTYAGGGIRDLGSYKNNSYSSYCRVYDGHYTAVMSLHEFGHSFGNLCDEYSYTTEGYTYYDCVNCRASCGDYPDTSACYMGCDAEIYYYRPDYSVMIDFSYPAFNEASIEATYPPDGLRKRLQYFVQNPAVHVSLNVSKSGTGDGSVKSNPSGIDCGSTCTASYGQGTIVTLTATASSGSVFAGWLGVCSGTGDCVVTMDRNKSVTATFNVQHTLTLMKTGTGDGIVTSSPAGISCGSACNETFQKVTKVKLTAKANADSIFVGWSGGDCSGTKPCQVTVDSAITVTASFDKKAPHLSVSSNPLQFGSVKVGKGLKKTLQIANNGTGDLWVRIGGLGGPDFSVAGSTSITVKPKKSYKLSITFKPVSTGDKTATLVLNSDDPDTPTISISLSGTGI